MKKKILFVMESLGIGGAEKSLVTVLSNIDYTKYEVDLFLFRKTGEFLKLIPKEVNILDVPKNFYIAQMPPMKSLKEFLVGGKVKCFMYRATHVSKLLYNMKIKKKEYLGWNETKNIIPDLEGEYDTAIGFLEKKTIYFVVDKVIAKKKIGWVHTNYRKIQYDYNIDSLYFRKLDNIVTVSNNCKKVLEDIFKDSKDKISVINNMVSKTLITRMSKEKIESIFLNKKVVLCTVCRLIEQKGIDIAIECFSRLTKERKDLIWIVVGDGREKRNLQKLISEKGLDNSFFLIGSRENPYPYIKACDIYVQPSRYEGFGITVIEAKALGKPIIVSNIPEFKEQIINEKTGLIYEDIDDMVRKLQLLLDRSDIGQKFRENLYAEADETEFIMNDIYRIIN